MGNFEKAQLLWRQLVVEMMDFENEDAESLYKLMAVELNNCSHRYAAVSKSKLLGLGEL